MKTNSARLINSNPRLFLAVAVSSLLLAGCSSARLSLPSKFEIPENDPSFRARLYTGASFGSSKLDPNLSSAPVFGISSDSDNGTQLRIGYDLHNMLSLELDTSVLGEANLSSDVVDAATSVKYSAFTASALIYGVNGVQNRSRREGISAYGRLGYSYLKRASAVLPLDKSNSSPVIGLGAEYGMKNGVGIRGEVTRFDGDATMFSIGAIYRFGLSARQIGGVIAAAAEPALTSEATYVGNGRIRGQSVQQKQRKAPQPQQHPTGVLAAQTWAPRVSRYDDDGDGVRNRADRCPDSAPNSTVGNDGCGLFDATLSDVVFRSGSHWLTPKARGQLDKLANTMLAFPESRVQIRAHTDSRGPADDNMDLSERRAEAVVNYLLSKGIAELQLEALGLGESQPMDSNDTADGRKRNRRIEVATLSNVGADLLAAMNKKEEVDVDVDIQSALAVAKTTNAPFVIGRPGEPVFPSVPAVKLPELPKPGFAAGFTMAGVVPGVSFKPDSAELTDSSIQALQKLRDQLAALPEVSVAVMAHTDDKGEEEANQTLSVSRALAVVDYLVSQGISKPRLLPEGYGETLPLVQNVTEEDRARNRRIEIRVINQ